MVYLLGSLVLLELIKYPNYFPCGPGRFTCHDGGDLTILHGFKLETMLKTFYGKVDTWIMCLNDLLVPAFDKMNQDRKIF